MDVYTIFGAPPEIQAYALAKYSRSAQSMHDSIEELSTQRAEQFLQTFYFQYGHRSIADLAHLTMGVEGISILAAFYCSDEPLWDGQSRSSRYQDFRKNGWYTPPQLMHSELAPLFERAVTDLIDRYEEVTASCVEILRQIEPRPAEMSPAVYSRTLKARAFDIARYLLPLAMRTSFGQITSARVLEQQISRLLGSRLQELQEIGNAMKLAAQSPARNFIATKLAASWQNIGLAPEFQEAQETFLRNAGILGEGSAPTLVKYTAPDRYTEATLSTARKFLSPLLSKYVEPADTSPVTLMLPESDPLDALIASLLYRIDPQGRSYAQLQPLTSTIEASAKIELLKDLFGQRGEYDEWLRLHRVGYAFGFDICIDFGAMRDLHRHRRCIQIIPDLKTTLGHPDAATIFAGGLGMRGAEIAAKQGLTARLNGYLDEAMTTATDFPDQEAAVYLLPLGARQRALFKMDLAEAAYIIELRSKVGGHFAYRTTAWEMHAALTNRFPYLSEIIRVTNPTDTINLLSR